MIAGFKDNFSWSIAGGGVQLRIWYDFEFHTRVLQRHDPTRSLSILELATTRLHTGLEYDQFLF